MSRQLRTQPMRRWQHLEFLLACTLALLGGCTAQSHAPTTDAGTLELKIRAGDEIRVVTTRRERLGFKVREVRGDRFVGVTVEPHAKESRPAGEAVEVPFEELAMVQVTRFDRHSVAVIAAVVTVSAFALVLTPVAVVPMAPPAL